MSEWFSDWLSDKVIECVLVCGECLCVRRRRRRRNQQLQRDNYNNNNKNRKTRRHEKDNKNHSISLTTKGRRPEQQRRRGGGEEKKQKPIELWKLIRLDFPSLPPIRSSVSRASRHHGYAGVGGGVSSLPPLPRLRLAIMPPIPLAVRILRNLPDQYSRRHASRPLWDLRLYQRTPQNTNATGTVYECGNNNSKTSL